MKEKIRVGLVRCDTHGLYYGPQMQAHDALLFDLPVPMGEPTSYSWMRGGNHFYFYTSYADPTNMTAPAVDGFEIVKLWDKKREAAELAARIFLGKPAVCDRFEQVSDDVDLVLIADCNGDGSDHLELAAPGLRKGVATFVDKPFAHRLADVREMLDLSARHGAPVMSMSMLQAVPGTRIFAHRLEEVGEAEFGAIQGGGTKRAGLIHTICMAISVFGPGVETACALTGPQHTSVHLGWGEQSGRPRHGVMINCDSGRPWHCSMHLSAFGPGGRGAVHSPGMGDWDFPQGSAEILRLVKRMVETGEPPPGPTNCMIEAVAVADAADRAIETGEPQAVEAI